MKTYIALLLLMTLSACDKARDFFGLTRDTPDAFQVVENAPLEIPKKFCITPPKPGISRPQEKQSRDIAKEKVWEQLSSEKGNKPTGAADRILLEKAGAKKQNPNIRAVIQEDNRLDAAEKTTIFQKMGLQSASLKGDVINPTEELERLKEKNLVQKEASL